MSATTVQPKRLQSAAALRLTCPPGQVITLDPHRAPVTGDEVLVLGAGGVHIEPYHGQAYLSYAECNEVLDLDAEEAAPNQSPIQLGGA